MPVLPANRVVTNCPAMWFQSNQAEQKQLHKPATHTSPQMPSSSPRRTANRSPFSSGSDGLSGGLSASAMDRPFRRRRFKRPAPSLELTAGSRVCAAAAARLRLAADCVHPVCFQSKSAPRNSSATSVA